MNVRKIPAFASLLVPTQTARTFVAAPLVTYYDLTREHAQVIRKLGGTFPSKRDTGFYYFFFFGVLRDKSTIVRSEEVF